MDREGTETVQCLNLMCLALNSEHKKNHALHRWDTKIYMLNRELRISQQEKLRRKWYLMNESES